MENLSIETPVVKKYCCQHNRQKSRFKIHGGSGICEHGKVKYRCKICGGSGICQHGKRKDRCTICCGSCIRQHGKSKDNVQYAVVRVFVSMENVKIYVKNAVDHHFV